MLPTIIFFFALLLSIFTIFGWLYFIIGINNIRNKIYKIYKDEQADLNINMIMTFIICILWSYLFYLLH